MEKIKIAQIVNAVGLKGEVKVYNYSDVRERFEELDEIIVSEKKLETPRKIKGVRYQGNMVILKLEDIDDRTAAEKLKGADLYITEADLRELPEDTFYVRDLIGMKVVDEGIYGEIGILKDVLQNTSQDIYVVRTDDGRDILIPAVKDFIKSVDQEKGIIITTLIPGFLDEGAEA